MERKTSIVIVNYRVKDLLKECLNSIFNSIDKMDNEIIVIDNNSKDGSVELLKNEFPQIRLIENHQNKGFAFACNQGIKKSSGEYILLLNPDTVFPQKGFGSMIEFMDSNPKAGICGSKMVDEQGNLLYSCRSFPSFLTSISSSQSLLERFFPGNPLSRKYLLKDINHSRVQEVDWVSGSCLFARGKMLDEIGLMDEDFFVYVEDVDLCYRAHQAGWKVYYFPQVTFIHRLGQSTSQDRFKSKLEHHRSMWIFAKKHFHPNILLRSIIFFGILVRLIFISFGYIIYRGRKRS